jgi:hypothetical protein
MLEGPEGQSIWVFRTRHLDKARWHRGAQRCGISEWEDIWEMRRLREGCLERMTMLEGQRARASGCFRLDIQMEPDGTEVPGDAGYPSERICRQCDIYGRDVWMRWQCWRAGEPEHPDVPDQMSGWNRMVCSTV